MPGRSIKCRLLAAVAVAPLATVPAAAAPSPLIDTQTSAPVTNVSREELEKLPVGRRLEDLIRTCPSNTIPTISRQPDVLIDGKPVIDLNCVQPADLDMIEVYEVHNIARAEYGAPPLVWDPALVQSSAAVAGQRVRTGTLEHSSREGRGTVRENLSQGLPWWSTQQLLSSWTKEKKNFVPGIFPNVSRTHNWYDIGHWAQMIWIQTVLIGCTKAVGGASAWLVCHYNPGGNRDGKPVGIPPARQYAVDQPKLPTTEVFNGVKPNNQAGSGFEWGDVAGHVRVDQAWGAAQPSAALHQLEAMNAFVPPPEPELCVDRKASLFDLGIYAGGAYNTDWFTLDASGGGNNLPANDGRGTGFVHYKVMVGDLPAWITFDAPPLDTNVEQPELPASEVFNRADMPKYCDDVM